MPRLFVSSRFRLGYDYLILTTSLRYSNLAAIVSHIGNQIRPRPFNPNRLSSTFRFGHYCLILSLSPKKYQNSQNTSLGIPIRPRPYNPISFASKISKFSKYVSRGVQIWPQPFNPISFASKISKFSKYLSLEI